MHRIQKSCAFGILIDGEEYSISIGNCFTFICLSIVAQEKSQPKLDLIGSCGIRVNEYTTIDIEC